MLPAAQAKPQRVLSEVNGESHKTPATRKGRGCHALPLIRSLMITSSNWFTITSSDDYHYPGVFHTPAPQRMGYCEDITNLPNFESTDPHFILSDVQLSKGNPRGVRQVSMNIDGKNEVVNYRIVPCNGVKLCTHHNEGCDYISAVKETRRCPNHPEDKLVHSSSCPVEIVYIWPEDLTDNRRWITGYVRVAGDKNSENLHNHPLNAPSKIPAKVDADIRRAVSANPHLKTTDIVIGKL